ncbi:MAG TPA: cation:proton antiporter, partial [Balneolaceae bacterium]|nr:cation:proton antiporter [Balneolaceae bacterium]
MFWQLELILFIFLLITALIALESKDLLVAAVMLTLFSFLMALLFTTMGAVD